MRRLSLAMMGLAIAGLMTMVSCRKPVNQFNTTGEKITFSATTENNSKTYAEELGGDMYVKWSKGDVISVNGNVFTLVGEGGETSGSFTGNVAEAEGYFASYSATNYGSSVTFNVPAEQDNGTNLNGKIPMVAYTTEKGGNLAFKNMVNILQLNLTGNKTITEIEVSSTEENLSGDFTVNSSLVPTAINAGTITKKITITKDMTLSSTAQTVYVVLPVFSSADSEVTVKFTGTEGVMTGSFKLKGSVSGSEATTPNHRYTVDVEVKLGGDAEGLCFEALPTTAKGPSTVKIDFGNFLYSIDGGVTFNDYEANTTVTLNNDGDKVYFKANGTNNTINEKSFETSGNLKVSGNIMYLLNGSIPENTMDGDNENCFKGLFNGCKAISDASELLLQAEKLAGGCYNGMFSGCSSLTEGPELPAEELEVECYYGMFSGCSSLTTAPGLPAEELKERCYYEMFMGCSSLTKAPELPAEELEVYCYYGMFSGCSNLAEAPELPAKELKDNCYCEMFSGCSSLTKAPELPATQLDKYCYSGMFSGCEALTEAPELPAEELEENCYSGMFSGCSSLLEAPELPAEELDEECYKGMFSGCSSLQEAPGLPATTLYKGCYQEMFSGCGNLAIPPKLPAEELKEECYKGMFSGCSLDEAPELQATTLSKGCYQEMFSGCESLYKVTMLATDVSANGCLEDWLKQSGIYPDEPTVYVKNEDMIEAVKETLSTDIWTVSVKSK